MKVNIVRPPIKLVGHSYNGGRDKIITFRDLLEAKVGDSWSASSNNCARDKHVESAKVVYNDYDGVALLIETETTNDVPYFEAPTIWRQLVWIELDK